MCKIVVREGTASLVVIPGIAEKISQENERGARNSPTVERGLTRALERGGGRFCPPLMFFANIFQSIRSIAVIFSIPAQK